MGDSLSALDWGLIILFISAGLFGLAAGLGKVLKILIDGIIGKIMAYVIAYGIFGFVSNMEFSKRLMSSFVNFLKEKDNPILSVLLLIRIDVIALAVVLFLIVRILQKLLVSLIAAIMEADNFIMKLVNRIGGFALAVAMAMLLIFIVFQIIALANSVDGQIPEMIFNSKLAFKLFMNNPLVSIIETLKHSFAAFFN